MCREGSLCSEIKPEYWRGNLQDVENTIKEVKKGKIHKLRNSAGRRPIYMVEYGSPNLLFSHATLSSALGAKDYSCYADKRGEDYRPTIFLVGCVHGGEWEGTVLILNLIHLLETGVDYAGNEYSELLKLLNRVHLLLLPMSNPDGRSHIPFDNFVGKTFYDLRYYNQGTWKDGSLCGWPECKRYFPIKEYVDYLGGYYNDAGVNMMHDDFFGEMSAETSNILDICRNYAPDISVLLHGGANAPFHFTVPEYVSGYAKKKNCQLLKRMLAAFKKENLAFADNMAAQADYVHEKAEISPAFNLISAMHHCCGEMCLTFESNQGLIEGNCMYNNEEIYTAHIILIRCILEMVTQEGWECMPEKE